MQNALRGRGKEAYINVYELDEETPEFVTKSFPSYDEEWLDYVALCRKGLPTGQTQTSSFH